MKKAICAIVTILALSYAAVLSSFCALTVALNHDEHQFMASAYMVARQGMQPYRDFAYFQMPNLVYVYSLFFFTPHPFLVARLFNALCGFGLCLIIFLTARLLFRSLGGLSATVLAAIATVLLPSTIFFQYTSSKVWNHSSALLCAVVAFSAQCKAIRESRPTCFLLSGFALGMAMGIRLTYAPLVAPFLVATLVFGSPAWRTKARSVLAFAIGGVLANLPAIYFCLTSCRDFVFGTFGYRHIDRQYFNSLPRPPRTMTLPGKLHHLTRAFQSDAGGLIVLVIALLGVIVLAIATIRRSSKPRFESMFLIGLLVFMLVGCLAPTPEHFQDYFALIPFLLLLGLYALSSVEFPERALAVVGIVVVAGISIFGAARLKKSVVTLGRVLQPAYWVPLQVDETAHWLRGQLLSPGDRKILTLSPIYAIEAGLPIYKEFVTGPFAWRISGLVPADEAAARKLPWAPGIGEFLMNQPPAAVLTGLEPKPQLEKRLIQELMSRRYWPIHAANEAVLWQPSNGP